MRAILYARVSGDDSHKEGRNLASQLEMCRTYAQEKGYTVMAELAEDNRGASGADWDLPQLNRALDMARAGEFDVLVTRELDRFARSLAKQLVIEAEFKRRGVEIAYVLAEYEDSPEGRLNKHIRAVVAEFERELINRRMTRGRKDIVRNGKVMLHGNKPPFGYRVEDKVLTIYEPEAETVKAVFDWYVYGDEDGKKLSVRAIAKRLTEAKIPTYADLHVNKPKKRKYGEWSPSVVAQLLSSETYAGTWCYGGDPELTVDVPVIVDRKTWERAQERKSHNSKMSKRNTKHEYLFSKRVTCQCGTKMTGRAVNTRGKLYLYYICPASRGQLASTKCDARSFRADQVDKSVWEWITDDLFSDPQRLANSVTTYLENETTAKQKVFDRVEVAESLLAENRQKLNRLLDLYLENPSLSKEWLIDKQKALETTIWSLEQELSQLHSTLVHWQTLREYYEEIGGDPEHWQEFVTKMATGAKNKEETIEKLDVRVVLFTDNGQQKAHIRCNLGEAVLSLMCCDSSSPC